MFYDLSDDFFSSDSNGLLVQSTEEKAAILSNISHFVSSFWKIL